MKMTVIVQFVVFQLVWWGLVISAQRGLDIIGWVLALIFVAVALKNQNKEQRIKETIFILTVASIGFVVDGLIAISGLVTYMTASNIVPVWLFFMWLAFAVTLKTSMQPFLKNIKVAVVSGLIFGPLSYEAGRAVGLIEFHHEIGARLVYALVWAVYMAAFSRASVSRAQ
jgi:hypothetical protein